MNIAVIIVNYGTADLAISAVASILENSETDHHAFDVHVVDNASPGEDAQKLAEVHAARGWGGRVTLWPESENHGFGRGNNVVLNELVNRESPPDYVFLLNPDARLANDVLRLLSDRLEAVAEAGAAGALISSPKGGEVTSAFRFPGMISELLRVADFGPLDRALARFRVPLSTGRPGGPVDWVSGAAVMFRFSALREVGFFDPDFFLYFEETELQHRLMRAGWKVLFEPAARVVHIEGAATGQFTANGTRQPMPDYLYRSRWMCLSKTHGRIRALATAILVIPMAGLNILQRGLRGKRSTLPGLFFRDHLRYGVLPLLRTRSFT